MTRDELDKANREVAGMRGCLPYALMTAVVVGLLALPGCLVAAYAAARGWLQWR